MGRMIKSDPGIYRGEDNMLKQTLTEQMVAVLHLSRKKVTLSVRELGEHRKPGELH